MKILKIFGIVVGIHVFLLILVFAIPGCTSTIKTAPTAADTVPKPAEPPPTISVPLAAPADISATTPTVIAFNPDTPAAVAPPAVSVSAARLTPTRPDTPVAGMLVAQPVDGVTPAASYIVKSGDNLSTIAKKNNLPVAQLIAANAGLTANTILRPGQKLVIPSKVIAPAAPTAKAADATTAKTTPGIAKPGDAMKHTVKSGENLGGIARIYGLRGTDIAVANNISDPAKIRPGMELVIPGWEPRNGKAGKAPSKAGSATKAADPKAPANLVLPPVVEPAPPVAPAVPVIRIEEPAAAPKR